MNYELLKELRNLNKDDVLHALGLEQSKSASEMAVPGLGIFVAGAIAGFAAGLMLAPKSGQGLRDDARDWAQEKGDQVRNKAEHLKDQAKEAGQHVKEAGQHAKERIAD